MSFSKYPNQIDTTTELPIAVDRKTQVIAEVVNRLRDAILAVESELGINPSREYGTVRARLDAIVNLIASGPVVGPVSSTDNAVARFDGVTGTKIQNSLVIVNDVGNIFAPGTVSIGTGGSGNLEASGGTLYCTGIGGTTNFDIVQRGEVDASLNTLAIVGSSSSGAGNAGGNIIISAGAPGAGSTYGTIQIGQCVANQLITWGEDSTATSLTTITIRGADNAASKGQNVVMRPGAGTLVTDDGLFLIQNARASRAFGAYTLAGPSVGVVLGNGVGSIPSGGEVLLDCDSAGARVIVRGTAPMTWNGNMTLGTTGGANTFGNISITHAAAANASTYFLTIYGAQSSGAGNAGGELRLLGGLPGAGGPHGSIQVGQCDADQTIKLGQDSLAVFVYTSLIRGADNTASKGQNVGLRAGRGNILSTDDGWIHITSCRGTPGTTQTGLYIDTSAVTWLGGGAWGLSLYGARTEAILPIYVKASSTDNRAITGDNLVFGYDQVGGVAVGTSTGLIRGADHTGVANSKGVDITLRPGTGNAVADHGVLRLQNYNSVTALTIDVNAYVEITSNNMYFDYASSCALYHETDSVGLVGRTFSIIGQQMTAGGSVGGSLHLRAGVGTAEDGYLELQDAGGLSVISITPDAKSQFHSNMIMTGDYSFLPYLDDIGNVGAAGRRFSLVRAVTITSGDIGFEDECCPLCGGAFVEGDELILKVMRKEDDNYGHDVSYTVPTHLRCARGD